MIISSLITRLVSSLDPRKRQLSAQGMYRKSGLTLLKKYLRDVEIRILLFIQSVQSVFLSFEMVFNLLKAKLELLWCIERTVWGLQAAWRVLFITFRHMTTTQYHSSNEKRETGSERDVNKSDSDPWNIWCRNLIYFKSSSVLWAVQNNGILNYVRNWKSPLVEKRTFCIFWPVISGDQGDSDQLMRCLRWSLVSSLKY